MKLEQLFTADTTEGCAWVLFIRFNDYHVVEWYVSKPTRKQVTKFKRHAHKVLKPYVVATQLLNMSDDDFLKGQ